MKPKSRKRPFKPTLHECKLVEVTDPAEFAYLESRVQKALKEMAERERLLESLSKPKTRKRKA